MEIIHLNEYKNQKNYRQYNHALGKNEKKK